nr:patatin-like phospholipase family protein [Rhodococcus sp. HNM0569]
MAIEGGGNRGVISGGMAAALDEAGLLPAFDAVYGSSSGTLTAAWLLSAHVQTGLQAWTEPEKYARMSRPWNPLTRRPLFDLQWLIEEFYDRTLGLDADHILANPISLHPLATDAATGESVDLGPLVRDRASLHLAMRASAALPILAGKPVRLGGRNFLDAGLAESIPLDTPIAAGATHVLVLTSRRRGETTSDSPAVRWVTDRWLRRAAPGARAAFADRNARGLVIAERLAHYNTAAGATPSVMAVHPAPDSPDVGRSESDAAVMRAGARAGGDAMRRALAGMLEQR